MSELRRALLTGEPFRRGSGEPAEQGHGWGPERSLPASELYELLVGSASGLRAPRAATLEGVRITGRLDLHGAELRAPLACYGCYFDEPVNLMLATAVEIRFDACHLPGLAADRLVTRGDLELSRSALGVVSLVNAHVGSRFLLYGTKLGSGDYPLNLSGAPLYPSGNAAEARPGVSLVADGLRVDGDMFCEQGFDARGEICLPCAHIRGQLGFNEATLGRGLTAYWLTVDGSMFCEQRFSAQEKVWLAGSRINKHLGLNGATLGGGLDADWLKLDGHMYCEGLSAQGSLRLGGAHITGQLLFARAAEAESPISQPLSLMLGEACIEGRLTMYFPKGFAGEVDLTNARMGRLSDCEQTWPERLRLRGLVYASIDAVEDSGERRGGWPAWHRHRPGHTASDVARRLRWIRRAEESPYGESSERAGYAPQPYTQLMAYYRREGRDSDARRVAYERESRRWRQLGTAGKMWNGFLRWTVGYGYRPLRALGLLVVLMCLGTVAFSRFHTAHEMVAVKVGHPPFDAIIYTLDRLTPVVSFGLREAYAPRGAAQWWAFGYALLGWTLSIAVVAGLSSAVRRAD